MVGATTTNAAGRYPARWPGLPRIPRLRQRGAPTSPFGIFCALLSEVACMPAAHPASSGIAAGGRGVGPPMFEVLPRRGRRADAGGLAAAAAEFAELGWPVCSGAAARGAGPSRHRVARGQPRGSGRACSCDRIGCPAPGAHPISAAWQIEASSDPAEVSQWWRDRPDASIILVTGRVFDVLDVPARAGLLALERMGRSLAAPGPVALSADSGPCFLPPPAAHTPTRTNGGPVTWTASRTASPRWPGCAGTAGTATWWPPAAPAAGPAHTGSGIPAGTPCRTACSFWSTLPTPARRC